MMRSKPRPHPGARLLKHVTDDLIKLVAPIIRQRDALLDSEERWRRLALGLARATQTVPGRLEQLAIGAYGEPGENEEGWGAARRGEFRRADRIRRWLRQIKEAKRARR